MQPATEILARISRNSLANKDEIFTRLYRYMLRPDLYFLAYKNLYTNSGAATKGAIQRALNLLRKEMEVPSHGETEPYPV